MCPRLLAASLRCMRMQMCCPGSLRRQMARATAAPAPAVGVLMGLHRAVAGHDLSPHLPLLSRIARAHLLHPSEVGPFSSLPELLDEYPAAVRCMEYSQLDWPAVLQPVRQELLDAVSDIAQVIPWPEVVGTCLNAPAWRRKVSGPD
jgi:hypothetical protein